MRSILILLLCGVALTGCETLLNMPVQPGEPDPFERYDKSVDTDTVRDCLSGDNPRSHDPNCFYQKRDRKDEIERDPLASDFRAGHT